MDEYIIKNIILLIIVTIFAIIGGLQKIMQINNLKEKQELEDKNREIRQFVLENCIIKNRNELISENPILGKYQLGLERDTNLVKIGDGKTSYNQLKPYDYVASIDDIYKIINEVMFLYEREFNNGPLLRPPVSLKE